MLLPLVAVVAGLAQPPAVAPPISSPPAPPVVAGGQGSVQLRGQVAPLTGEIGTVSYGGVLLKTSSDDPGRLISWDRIRTVEGAGLSIEAYRQYGDGLMRARARLERGDVWLADRAIDPLYQRDGSARGAARRPVGPAARRVLSALEPGAQCDGRGDGCVAFLELGRPPAGETGGAPGKSVQWVGGGTNLPPVLDASTGLCPLLPPIFSHQGPNSAGMLRVLTTSPHLQCLCSEKSAVRGVAAPYLFAARLAAGEAQAAEISSLPTPVGDAEQLVSDVVAAQSAAGDASRAARQRLQKRLELLSRDAETKETDESDAGAGSDRSWQRAWLHAAIGRSLLNEDQRTLRRQGLVELLYVPALDGNTQPGLAATALLDVLEELRRDNDTVGGGNDNAIAAVSAELRTRFGVEPPPAETAPLPGPAPVPTPAPAPPLAEPSNSPPSKESP
ncbi:MAG: hypothetical protein QM783_07845 [Phycisphaerales bacterium]